MPVPTWRLAAVAAAGALLPFVLPGAGVLPGVMALFNALLLVVATADWLLAPPAGRVTVSREAPAALPLDTPAQVVWRVGNPTRRRLSLRLADQLPPSLRATRRRAAVRVPAGGQASAATSIRPARRGRFELSAVTVRADGPLGLVARQGVVHVPASLRVLPQFPSRREAELRLSQPWLHAGLRTAQGRGGGTDFDALREYTVDDEFRRIDWAATARARRAMVRTYRPERNQQVLVLLDAGRTMAGQVGVAPPALPVPRFEHALDAVLLLVALAGRLGDRVGVVAFADEVRTVVPPAAGKRQLTAATDALYALEPALVESDYARAFAETLARFRRRALLVVLTELAAQAAEETLLPALPLVSRHHLVMVGAVRDPRVQSWAASAPADAQGAYRKAAAIAALQERHRTVRRLRGMGALVVDAPPGRLGAQLADAYLSVKATGRL